MISSRRFAALGVVLATSQISLPTPVGAQDSPPPFHVEMYLEATRAEREGYEAESREFRRRSLEGCLQYARQSYDDTQSILAAWRLASCAGGLQDYLGAFLAFSSFESLVPGGLLSWSHSGVDQADMARVHAIFGEVPRNIGGIRLVVVPESASVASVGQEPVEITARAIPALDHQFISYEGVFYAPVGVTRAVRVELEGFESDEVGLTFEPLSGGVREVRIELRESAAPVVEPAPIARAGAPLPMPAVVQPRPPPVTFVEEETGGASGLAVLGWTGLITGVLGAGSGALLWGLADSIRQDLDAACPTRTGCDPALRADYEQGRDFTQGGNILTIAGAGIAALGIVFLVIDATRASEASVGVRANATGVQVQIGGVL